MDTPGQPASPPGATPAPLRSEPSMHEDSDGGGAAMEASLSVDIPNLAGLELDDDGCGGHTSAASPAVTAANTGKGEKQRTLTTPGGQSDAAGAAPTCMERLVFLGIVCKEHSACREPLCACWMQQCFQNFVLTADNMRRARTTH